MHRLLILSCSKRKRSNPELLPAIERYDGPAFRLLRRFLQGQSPELLDIYILSAEFGLIPANQSIPDYDRQMTPQRTRELQLCVIEELTQVLSKSYKELFIYMSRIYLQAMEGYDRLFSPELTIRVATGGLGKKLAELYSWLYKPHNFYHKPPPVTRQPRIRGIEVALTSEQVLDVARRELAEGRSNSTRYQAWYILVDGKRVAPKWLISQLTGLPVSSFHTNDAIRVLQQLGIQVYMI
jgi:hypothetical protein